ncbi:MAG TPA: hypothetical protein VGQ33_23935 [Vicinamibacteria bacterium]|jgi:hypothetical protein|nr:hypothetical protein [Vicinamibacteria bacterium]
MPIAPLLLLVTALADSPATVPAQIRLRDGTTYHLKEPPFLKDGRFVFKTTDGKVFSLSEKEVDDIHLLGPTPVPRAVPNPQDSRSLGAVARQERRKTGKRAPVAPAPTPRPPKPADP